MQSLRLRASALGLLLSSIAGGCSGARSEGAPPPVPSATSSAKSAASAPAASGSAAPAAPAFERAVSVTYSPSDDAWDVTWSFREPTTKILFDRRSPANRHATWTPGPGMRWKVEGDNELLESADGSPRRELSARFATDDSDHGRAPPLNLRFTDGGRLLFTAQLGAHAIGCDPSGRCDRRDLGKERVWTFHAPADRTVRVLDAAAPGELTWHEPAGDLRGTYAYVGTQQALADERVSIVLDPGLPSWLSDETRRVLPGMFALHAKKTGILLELKPVVFASRAGASSPGSALRGRTLPGMIQIEAAGGDWSASSPAREALWFELMAHESFHFWNAQLARRSGDGRDEWLSEGSAVYVAGLALREAKLLDDAAFAKRAAAAGSGCAASLEGPLYDEKADRSYYDCGSTLLFALDRKLAPGGGVYGALAAMFREAREKGSYGTADFLAIVAERAHDDALVKQVRDVLDHGLGADPEKTVQRLLASGGLKTKIAPARGRGSKPSLEAVGSVAPAP